MKYLTFLALLIFGLGFRSETAKAYTSSEICFLILWEADEGSSTEGKQLEGGQDFIKINGTIPVTFYRSQDYAYATNASGRYLYSHSKGCTNSKRLSIGQNNFAVNFIIGNNQPITSGYLRVTAWAVLPNGSQFTIGKELYSVDPNRTNWSFNKSLNLTLDQIAPELAALANELKGEVARTTGEFSALSPTIDADIKNCQDIMSEIEAKDFYAITEADLANYKEAQDRYIFLKSQVEAKKESIAQTTARLKAVTAAARVQIENALASEGLDIKTTDVLDSSIAMDIERFANLGDSPDLHEARFPFQAWAQEALQDLTYLYDAGQTANFLQRAEEYTRQSEHLLDLVSARTVVSREELNDFEQSNKLVTDYLYGTTEANGKITSDYWMKSLNVPADIRNALDVDLKAIDEAKAQELKLYVNGLKALSERIINNLRVLSELTQAYKLAQEEKERKFLDVLIEGSIAAIKNAPEIAKCLGKNYAAGPYADFYEFYYERDFCTDEPNTELDRFIAGASLTLEAGSTLLATPVGGWAATQLATPIKFVTKIGTVVKKAAAAKTAAKLERIGSVLSAGIITKTIKSSDEAKIAVKGAFHLGAEMEEKILKGAINAKGRYIGGHSASVLRDPNFIYKSKTLNADGTLKIEGIRVTINGKGYTKPTSTIFPENWSDDKILSESRKVAGSKEVGRRVHDGATLHIQIMDNVEIVVIREGEKVTSSFPTGIIGDWVKGFERL